MDFKHTGTQNTPKSQINIFNRISHGVISSSSTSSNNTESPFRNIPTFSTPPSRFSKIINPFEQHLIDTLHLPTISPNLFPSKRVNSLKNEEKFKWSIDDISNLQPADIDESTVNNHVTTVVDPQVESLMQQKIKSYFNQHFIIPSPMSDEKSKNSSAKLLIKPSYCEGFTQTNLSLPPVLPKELEEALKPYFSCDNNDDEINENPIELNENNPLYRQLFNNSPQSSSTYNSPTQSSVQCAAVSPLLLDNIGFMPQQPMEELICNKSFDIPELRDCTLSPINKNNAVNNDDDDNNSNSNNAIKNNNIISDNKGRTSACKLDFTDKMCVDTSLMFVPDVDVPRLEMNFNNETNNSLIMLRENQTDELNNSTNNWSMEYKQISLESPKAIHQQVMMDISNSETPHSKLFIGKGQRKRLSESFKYEEYESNNYNNETGEPNTIEFENIYMKSKSKIFRNNDLTTTDDFGYCTKSSDFSDNTTCSSSHAVFASTPTRRKK